MALAGDKYERDADLISFDATRTGVKGIVDSNTTAIPRIFHHDHLIDPIPTSTTTTLQIPTIDLHLEDHSLLVCEVKRAATEWGFFQVVGHGVPVEVTTEMIEGVRRFNEEEDEEIRKGLYSRENQRRVKWSSNFDLFKSKTANWRDTLFCSMLPVTPSPEELPPSCREITMEYSKQMLKVGEVLLELLSEALGLNSSYLKDMECSRGHNILCHYYPSCPDPNLAIGTSRHSDSGFLTVLLQDQIGGLQVLHEGQWVNVPPLPDAFVVNIGDLLQLMTNEKFRSVEHRVLANTNGPRISVACFFTMHFSPLSTRLYGPIKELISEDNPPLYKEVLVKDYVAHYYDRGLSGKLALSRFRLQ